MHGQKNIKFSSKYAVFSRITKGSLSHKYPSTRSASAAPGQDFPKILACRKFHILVRGTIFVVRVTDRNFRGILWQRVATEIDEIRETTTTTLSVWKKRISNTPISSRFLHWCHCNSGLCPLFRTRQKLESDCKEGTNGRGKEGQSCSCHCMKTHRHTFCLLRYSNTDRNTA